MHKKLTLIFTTIIFMFAITSCGKTTEVEVEEPTQGIVVNNEDTDEGVEAVVDYTWEDIAELNNLEQDELNTLFGYNGNLLFLGNKYGEELVTNEDEALDSLKHIETIAGLNGIELQYNRTDVSPVTGNVVYTFYQINNSNIDGQVMAAKFYNSLVKVITDGDGNILGVSADIIPKDEVEVIDESEIITEEEAIAYVESLINNPNRKIYKDACEYAFWDDEGTVLSTNAEGKISPAWFVYTDAESNNKVGKPYEVFVVSLTPRYMVTEEGDEFLEPSVISNFYAETLDLNDAVGVYTSELYFDGMKDVGDYTYDINMDWVKKYYPEYNGPAKASYTVPVMYSEKEELYYLGNAAKKITLSNFYDFILLDTTNAYVTDNPEDKDSWHFQLDKAEDGSTGKYFDNPDYVLSSFSVMCDVWEDYYERYGLDSVDGSGMPTILAVYQQDTYEYPEKESDFAYNAANRGQNRDWQVMTTSITFPGCLEHEIMSHEYTHGINSQLTMSQYLNGSGAVMEAYADIIGMQMSALNEYPESILDEEWHIGGVMIENMRDMGDPKSLNMPQYLGGNYFLFPVDEVMSSEYDAGGVHTNSSVLNYLTYCMVNGTGEDNEATLTMDECLDVWFDTLYYTNHQSDYYDVACYLRLAAQSMDLPAEKQAYIRKLLGDLAFTTDENGEFSLSYTEESNVYNINFEYDDSVYNNLADVFKFGFTFYDENDNYYDAGGISENSSLSYAIDASKHFELLRFAIGDTRTYESEYYYLDNLEELPHDMDAFFTVNEATPGDTYNIDSTLEVSYIETYDDAEYDLEFLDDGAQLEILSEGTLVITFKDLEVSTDDYGKYTIMMIVTE